MNISYITKSTKFVIHKSSFNKLRRVVAGIFSFFCQKLKVSKSKFIQVPPLTWETFLHLRVFSEDRNKFRKKNRKEIGLYFKNSLHFSFLFFTGILFN